MSIAAKLPEAPVDRLTRPLARFLHIESAGGIVLLVCAVAALAFANSPAATVYHDFWHTPVALQIGAFQIGGELGHFVVNDVFMTIFFFVVGLEIKRELICGELNEVRKAALPVIAAIGGMVVPAGLYFALMHGKPGQQGWGIPMATDIAFVVGVMSLLGNRVPLGLKILLLSLAIADDIGAVLVIAAFYSGGLDWPMLLMAGYGLLVVLVLRGVGVRTMFVYTGVGIFVWLAFLRSGVHPAVAGVILGLMTPTVTWVSRAALRLTLADTAADLRDDDRNDVAAGDLRLLAFAAKESISPLERLQTRLHPWVGFAIMPIFALANADVEVNAQELSNAVALSVALGLFLGKPAGVLLASWLAIRLGFARLPDRVTWAMVAAAGILAGIGFTMSLFVGGLALEADHVAAGKMGILTGSLLSAVVGLGFLAWSTKNTDRKPISPDLPRL